MLQEVNKKMCLSFTNQPSEIIPMKDLFSYPYYFLFSFYENLKVIDFQSLHLFREITFFLLKSDTRKVMGEPRSGGKPYSPYEIQGLIWLTRDLVRDGDDVYRTCVLNAFKYFHDPREQPVPFYITRP